LHGLDPEGRLLLRLAADRVVVAEEQEPDPVAADRQRVDGRVAGWLGTRECLASGQHDGGEDDGEE
jgi:hypothetical protein